MSRYCLSAEDREARDWLAFQLFLAGQSYRAIGKHPRVQLSCRGVELAIERQLSASALRRNFLTDEVIAVHVERLEALYAAAYPRAVRGDTKAGEHCRRLLDSLGKLHGICPAAGEAPAPEEDPADDRDENCLDPLEAYRLRCKQQQAAG